MNEQPTERRRHWHVDVDYEQLPARALVDARRPGESPRAARARRAQELADARTQSPVEGVRITLWDIGPSIRDLDVAQRDPIAVPLMPHHACCAAPDAQGHVYPVCGMSAYDCAGYDWF